MRVLPAIVALAAGCGGSRGADPAALDPHADPESRFGPLEIGADYASYRKLTDKPFQSLDHGNRWVDVYVNARGADAYLSGAPMPVGSIVVKTSVQNDHGRPSAIEGPVFVMEKRARGYDPPRDDWYYAIRWADPPPGERAKLGGPFYWRGKSPHVAYCWECHDSYDRRLGGLTPSSQLPR
ncbi:MAG TPA: cytochrome P460 family protein [Kofleriaceae bacterium]